MSSIYSEDAILPRPVEILPEYAHAKARQALSDKLVEAFHLSLESATAISNAVVDPTSVRKAIGDPLDPEVEKISVPGGTLLGLRTSVWSRRAMPDPRNPRILPSRRHPFAVDPGTGGEDSKFRPIPEPRPRELSRPTEAELTVDIENRHQLTWASQQAASYVLAENDWRSSIASQGVMEAVWLVATTYEHSDGTLPVTTLTTAEGSSRLTAVHALLTIRSADVPYDDQEAKFRGSIRKLNERFMSGADGEVQTALRCERIPALILVGFVPHPTGTTGFPTAVKSMVALRHVDPPKPWGEGPENESLADEVLDELYRQNLISNPQKSYYAGSCTRAEAKAAHLSDDPAVRASEICRLFASVDPRVNEAIRVAVTSQSTRKRITTKLSDELATALILRAYVGEPSKSDQIRRYLRHAFGKAVHREIWEATGRSTEQLVAVSLQEVRTAIGDANASEVGPASLELAVRAAYPLVVSGRLNADRGSFSDQPDRRNPGEVLDAMRQTVQGVMQLGQALHDFSTGVSIRAVDENGALRRLADQSGEQMVSDIYLRGEFPPAGKARAQRPGDTPTDRFRNRLAEFGNTLAQFRVAFDAVNAVLGDDGQPLVDAIGVDPKNCEAWREDLRAVDEDLIVWARTFRRKYGAASTRQPSAASVSEDVEWDQDENDVDPYQETTDDRLLTQ